MDKFYFEFGQALKQRRMAISLTQDDVASRVGLGRTSVTNIEKGRQQVSLHLFCQLAAAVDADPLSLLPVCQKDEAEKTEFPQELEDSLASLDDLEQRWAREFLQTPEALASLGDKS